MQSAIYRCSVLEIMVGHSPFSNQFQHLADQNLFLSTIFPIYFHWDNSVIVYKISNLKKTADQFLILISSTGCCEQINAKILFLNF